MLVSNHQLLTSLMIFYVIIIALNINILLSLIVML